MNWNSQQSSQSSHYNYYNHHEPVQAVVGPPPLTNLELWFDYYDVDGNGNLDVHEMTTALIETNGATTPQQIQETREMAQAVFSTFDTDHSGGIDKDEFCAPSGLGETLLAMTTSGSTNGNSNNTEDTWICTACSYRNYRSKISCTMCGTTPTTAATATATAVPPPFNPYQQSQSANAPFNPQQQHQQQPAASAPFNPYAQQQHPQPSAPPEDIPVSSSSTPYNPHYSHATASAPFNPYQQSTSTAASSPYNPYQQQQQSSTSYEPEGEHSEISLEDPDIPVEPSRSSTSSQQQQQPRERSAEEWKEKGNECLQAGKYSQAIDYYTAAIQMGSQNNKHVYFSNRSAAYLSLGDAHSALNDAETCIQLSENSFPKGYSRKGAALHALKRYDDSIHAYQVGLAKFPNDKGLQNGLEMVQKEQPQKEQPKQLSAEDWKTKGNQSLKAGKFSQAIDHYTSAIGMDPSNHVYFSNRSAAYLSLGDAHMALNDAETCIQKASASGAKFPKGYSRKGAALHKLQRYQDSIDAYKLGLRKFPNDPGLKNGLNMVQREQPQSQQQSYASSNQYQQQSQQQQQPMYQTMRIPIPAGMQPGQQLHVRTGYGDQLALVTIPSRRNWIMPHGGHGQPSFEARIAINTNGSSSNSNHSSSQQQQHHQQQQQQQQEPWQSFDSFRGRMVSMPRVGDTRTVSIPPSLHIIRASGRYRALLIGINYTGTRAALRGCINDAQNMKRLLMQNGYPNDSRHMVMLTDDRGSSRNYQPTGANIIKGIQWLIQGASYGDILFFHFSGHGAQVPDQTGQEADGLNETILPLDYKNKQITDDELWGNLVYPLPNGTRLTAIMDCCHSGTGLDLPYEYKLKTKNHMSHHYAASSGASNNEWVEEINPAHSQGDVILLSGCEDSQTSADTTQYGRSGGAMTQAFVKAYEQLGRTSSSSFPQLFSLLHKNLRSRGFSQRPQLTSSQPFNVHTRMFSLTEGIEPNHNRTIGRVSRKRIKPNRQGGNRYNSGMDLDDFLFGGGGTAGKIAAVALGAAVLGALFD